MIVLINIEEFFKLRLFAQISDLYRGSCYNTEWLSSNNHISVEKQTASPMLQILPCMMFRLEHFYPTDVMRKELFWRKIQGSSTWVFQIFRIFKDHHRKMVSGQLVIMIVMLVFLIITCHWCQARKLTSRNRVVWVEFSYKEQAFIRGSKNFILREDI